MDIIATSVNDAAKALGLGRMCIYRRIREGRLEVVELGPCTLIRTDSIRRIVQPDAA